MTSKNELRRRWEREPGRGILDRLTDLSISANAGHGRSSEEMFRVLDLLPYRDEVESGRDLRGSDFPGGVEWDFSRCDFSFARSLGLFIKCDLTAAKFDEISCRSCSFGSVLDGATFEHAMAHSCFFMNAKARGCHFKKASLIGSRFDEADLSGSSFRGANCKRVCFADANLLGCDFTAAVLDEAVFVGAQIDRSTVFNGASLINAQAAEQYDRSGNLVRPGVDLKRATYDEQTRFGEDPTAPNVEVFNAAWELLESDDRPEARPVRAALSAIRQSRQERSDWQEYVPKTLPQEPRNFRRSFGSGLQESFVVAAAYR